MGAHRVTAPMIDDGTTQHKFLNHALLYKKLQLLNTKFDHKNQVLGVPLAM